MTHRHEQIVSTLQRALSTVIAQKLHDPRVRGIVSVTEVDMSPDRKQARVLVSVMPEKYESQTIKALEHATRRVHKLVCQQVTMRTVPHFDFKLDRSLKKQAEIYKAIDEGLERETQREDNPEPLEGDASA